VLLYASADNRSTALKLHELGVATLSVKADHIADFAREARLLGRVLGDSAAAAAVVDSVQRTLDRVRAATASLPHPTVFWVVWESPLMAVGGGSFLDELITIAGGTNIYSSLSAPSPVVSREDVLSRHPDVIFTSPQAAHDWQGRVLVPDTALIGHPSVRLGEAAVSLANLLHPGVVK
jgi:iron complex transport system substrate-binding protein